MDSMRRLDTIAKLLRCLFGHNVDQLEHAVIILGISTKVENK